MKTRKATRLFDVEISAKNLLPFLPWRKLIDLTFSVFEVYNVHLLQDLKANEARLQELNSIADKLTAMGHTEAAEKIRDQITVSSSRSLYLGMGDHRFLPEFRFFSTNPSGKYCSFFRQ